MRSSPFTYFNVFIMLRQRVGLLGDKAAFVRTARRHKSWTILRVEQFPVFTPISFMFEIYI